QAGQKTPVLEHQQETPQVRLVVDPHQGEADDPVGDGVGGQQQSEPPQVQFIDAQDAAEVLQGAQAVFGQVELAQPPIQAVVDKAPGEVDEEVAAHGRAGAFGVEAVVEEAVEDGVADGVVVVGLGLDAFGARAEELAAGAARLVFCVVDEKPGDLTVSQGADAPL